MDPAIPVRGAAASIPAASTEASFGRRTSVLLAILALITFPHASSAQSVSIANSAVRTLLSWLDDAEVIEPGGAEFSLGVSRADTSAGHESDAPALFAAAGVAPRVQVAATGTYYASSFADGFTSSGRGDTYLIAKIAVVSPREHPGGVAVSPLVEILSDLSVDTRASGSGRVAWGLPVSLQYTWTKVQVLATTGYFSRGSLFADAGVQAWIAQHAIGTLSVLHSHATTTTTLTDQFGLSLDRTDLAAGVDYLIRPDIALFGTIGRTIGTLDATALRSFFSLGITLRLASSEQSQSLGSRGARRRLPTIQRRQ